MTWVALLPFSTPSSPLSSSAILSALSPCCVWVRHHLEQGPSGAVAVAAPAHTRIACCAPAENSVGPDSTRPDDILHMYSGKTVEVNNTDAEGRLVLGDGVAYAERNVKPDIIIDMATLTGAQGISTGQKHGALYCNDDDLEALAVRCGKASGKLPNCSVLFASAGVCCRVQCSSRSYTHTHPPTHTCR